MNQQSKSWYEHPVYISAVAVAGTIALCVLIYKEVLLPAQMAASRFQIESLEREVERVSKDRASLENELERTKKLGRQSQESIAEELKQAHAELAATTTQLNEYRLGNLFLNGSPYPNELDAVKVGHPIQSVRKRHPNAAIEESEIGYWSLDVEHPYFRRITYYYSASDEESDIAIYQISFRAKYDLEVSSDFLQRHLNRAFGEPIQISENHYIWQAPGELNIFKSDNEGLIVADKDIIPGSWHGPIARYMKSKQQKEAENNNARDSLPTDRR